MDSDFPVAVQCRAVMLDFMFEKTSVILRSCQALSLRFLAMFCNHKFFCLPALAAQTGSAGSIFWGGLGGIFEFLVSF